MNYSKYIVSTISVLAMMLVSGCNNSSPSTEGEILVESISLSETKLTMFEGDTFTLTATVSPFNATNKGITWESKNPEVATIENGYVVAVKEGSTLVGARSVTNNKIYATCSVDVSKKQSENDSTIEFESRSVKVKHYANETPNTIGVYFRKDKLTQYPYISLKTYYHTLLGKNLLIQKLETDKYRVISANNEEALIDTKKNTLECDDLENFISTTVFRQDDVTNVYFDGAPFVRVNNVEHDKKPRKSALNFGKYGINIIGKEDDIILPLVTASNLFMGPTMLTCFYNKDCIYFIDPNDPLCDTNTVIGTLDYYSSVLQYFKDGKRTADEAKFAYGELCFFIDTFYGLPGREYLHDAYVADKDLDLVLSDFNDITRKARQLLLSTNEYEYFAGQLMLQDFLFDAGHSYSGYGANILYNYFSEVRTNVNKVLEEIPYTIGKTRAARNASTAYQNQLVSAHNNSETTPNGYIVRGDTLIYRFDSFNYDIHTWNDYYKNPTLENLPNDPVGNFKRMLEQYEGNKSISNVLVDISTNGGGYGDVVVAFMGLMTGRTYQHSHDMVNDNYITVHYDFDANFDGVFDEKDKAVKYSFNFAILCSAYSFSCGNLLPAQARECGLMLLGDKSGGGSCAVLDAITAEGLYVRLSSQDHMVTLKNEEVEMGVEVHKTLVSQKNTDYYDFSEFYDFDLISQEIHKFYA